MHINDLPNPLIGNIMSFADFGGTPRSWNAHRPAARFARVSKRWHATYAKSVEGGDFVANNELSRIGDWSVTTTNTRNEGRMQRSFANRHGWWCSDMVFEGGRWIDGAENSEGGPFGLRPNYETPTLYASFRGTVQLRALLFCARNRPRKVILEKTSTGNHIVNNPFSVTIDIPPPAAATDGLAFWKNEDIPRYDSMVNRMLPQGNEASDSDHRAQNLPVVIPGGPFVLEEDENLCISIIESHERQWVGINSLSFYGATLPVATLQEEAPCGY